MLRPPGCRNIPGLRALLGANLDTANTLAATISRPGDYRHSWEREGGERSEFNWNGKFEDNHWDNLLNMSHSIQPLSHWTPWRILRTRLASNSKELRPGFGSVSVLRPNDDWHFNRDQLMKLCLRVQYFMFQRITGWHTNHQPDYTPGIERLIHNNCYNKSLCRILIQLRWCLFTARHCERLELRWGWEEFRMFPHWPIMGEGDQVGCPAVSSVHFLNVSTSGHCLEDHWASCQDNHWV